MGVPRDGLHLGADKWDTASFGVPDARQVTLGCLPAGGNGRGTARLPPGTEGEGCVITPISSGHHSVSGTPQPSWAPESLPEAPALLEIPVGFGEHRALLGAPQPSEGHFPPRSPTCSQGNPSLFGDSW